VSTAISAFSRPPTLLGNQLAPNVSLRGAGMFRVDAPNEAALVCVFCRRPRRSRSVREPAAGIGDLESRQHACIVRWPQCRRRQIACRGAAALYGSNADRAGSKHPIDPLSRDRESEIILEALATTTPRALGRLAKSANCMQFGKRFGAIGACRIAVRDQPVSAHIARRTVCCMGARRRNECVGPSKR
jgi:hypothetical protein